jgi:hypothetical protein
MPKGWPHIESKANAERRRKQRHAPRLHILAGEERKERVTCLTWSEPC